MATLKSSAVFWDEKARENAQWYISTYGPYAGRSESEFWASGERIWSDLKKQIGYRPARRDVVVEIGCGIGRVTRAIAAEVQTVHAFDISPEMIRRARRNGPANAKFHVTRGDRLEPLADGSADLVLAYCVFQHLPSHSVLGAYLREMARVARAGALLAFTTAPRSWRAWLLPAARLKAALVSPLRDRGPRGLHRKEWVGIRPSRRQVQALCPIPLTQARLDGDRWLFWGRKAAAAPTAA
jgi:SAM-dependent methyltransferase